MGAIIIVDAFWGDAGKGKFSAHFSLSYDARICVRAGIGPNAGHSIFRNGELLKTRLVPLGLVNPSTKLMIGSGVAVDPDVLLEEVRRTETSHRLSIDFRCPIIEADHLRREQADSVMQSIDSTKSGAGAARADYVMRRAKRACDVASLNPFIADVALECNSAASTETIIVEGSQATFLSLYLSERYPFTTSDNCTTTALVDDVGLNWQYIERVVLLVKCLPTAVGNGPLPNEMQQEEIIIRGLEEFGVNTGRRRRRVRAIDPELLRYSVMLNGPTEIALTFCDQYDSKMRDVTDQSKITQQMIRLIKEVESIAGVPVRFLETGKELTSIIELD